MIGFTVLLIDLFHFLRENVGYTPENAALNSNFCTYEVKQEHKYKISTLSPAYIHTSPLKKNAALNQLD